MALSLEKYAEHLDARNDPRPLGPEPVPFPHARPHVRRLPDLRAVVYSGYGTTLLIQGGELHFLNPDAIMRKISLEKTIQEFKMWQSMTRRPGEPSQYMTTIFQQVLDRFLISDPQTEVRLDKIWDGILHRLFQKEYSYDEGFYGDRAEYCKKITYYYLRASQGVGCFPGLLTTARGLAKAGILQGIHANGQCATPVQLYRELLLQGKLVSPFELFDPTLYLWSFEMGFRKESERGFQALLKALGDKGLQAENVLYVGSDVQRDIVPAKRRGFRTALLLADRASAKAVPEELKDDKTKPNILITAFDQLLQVVGG